MLDVRLARIWHIGPPATTTVGGSVHLGGIVPGMNWLIWLLVIVVILAVLLAVLRR